MNAEAQKNARTTVTILFIAWIIDYVDRLVITLALPNIRSAFHLSEVAGGMILSAFSLTYMLFQIPGGLLSDRFGARKAMSWALALWSGFTALTGTVGSFIGLLLVRGGFGIFEGLFPAASMKAIGERVAPERRTTANSVMLSSNSFGAALAPLIAAPFMAAVGWRETFYLVAGLGIVMALVVWFGLPKPVSRDTSGLAMKVAQRLSVRDVLTSGAIWKFALMFGAFDIVIWGLLSWVPSYLIEARHLHLVKTGLLTAIPWFAGAIGTILGGWLFDRYFADHYRRLVVPAVVLGAGFLVVTTTVSSTAGYDLFLSLSLFFLQMAYLPMFGLPFRILPARTMASGSGIINFGGQAGAFVAPLIMGALIQHFSYNASFFFLIGAALVSALVAFWIPESPERLEQALDVAARQGA